MAPSLFPSTNFWKELSVLPVPSDLPATLPSVLTTALTPLRPRSFPSECLLIGPLAPPGRNDTLFFSHILSKGSPCDSDSLWLPTSSASAFPPTSSPTVLPSVNATSMHPGNEPKCSGGSSDTSSPHLTTTSVPCSSLHPNWDSLIHTSEPCMGSYNCLYRGPLWPLELVFSNLPTCKTI